MWLLIIAFIFSALTIMYHYNQRCKFSKLKNFSIRNGFPFLGILPDLYNEKELLTTLEKYVDIYEDSFATYLGPKPLIFVMDENTAEIVLRSNTLIEKSDEYELMAGWFGKESLLVSTGNTWRNRRKLLTPAFHYKILEEFCLIFDKCSNNLVKKLYDVLDETNEVDIYEYITLHALDIICETAMGIEVNAINNPNSKISKSVKSLCHILYVRGISFFYRFDFIYKFTHLYKQEMECIKILHDFSDNIIQKRREKLINPNESIITTTNEYGIKNKFAFLDIMLQSTINGEPLTDKQILEEVNTFLFEGHDTTTGALSFALYLLSRHYDVQQKVYEEILKLVGTNADVPLTQAMLQSMTYTEMVIKESMRLYPSVPVIARVTTEDTPCRGGIIKKGVTVAIVPYALHRNPNIYPDPYKFDPERFTIDNCTKRNPYAYVPFSAGPRNCIGQKFAMLEMKATIAKILLHFELIQASGDYKPHPISKMTMQSANGIRLGLKKRVIQ